MIPEIKLVIFDVDGTLCDRDSTDIYPQMIEKLKIIAERGLKVALATNQGGVGLRYWMESADFGDPAKYPTQDEVEDRILDIANRVEDILGYECAVYMSFWYESKSTGKAGPIPPDADTDPRWKSSWRKPNPGMLQAAMFHDGVTPQQTLFVGDSDEDAHAADYAGCEFSFVGDIGAYL